MGDKVYKPIIKDNDHLIRSKNNPNRVRGLTRDENNKNQDIIEWEEYDVDDLKSYPYVPYQYEERHSLLTPEQEKLVQHKCEELGVAIADWITVLFREWAVPWFKESALPRIKKQYRKINKKKKYKKTVLSKPNVNKGNANDKQFSDVSSQIDNIFEDFCFKMNDEEIQIHKMRLIYHMLGLVNEILIISNNHIREECQSDELCIERQKEAETFLSEKVAANLNQLLSNENIRLDLNTSKELFSLVGGGVRINGEYLPIEANTVVETLKNLHTVEEKL